MSESDEGKISQAINVLVRMNSIQASMKIKPRTKPVYGGPFGSGGWLIGSLTYVSRGLDKVTYIVAERETGFTIGVGGSVGSALSIARDAIRAVGVSRLLSLANTFHAEAQAKLAIAHAAESSHSPRKAEKKVVKIPRRRLQMFEKHGGKCFYCACELDLNGRWHIEHKLPRALGGTNDHENLTIACAPCNHKKRDKTDVEFVAQRAAA